MYSTPSKRTNGGGCFLEIDCLRLCAWSSLLTAKKRALPEVTVPENGTVWHTGHSGARFSKEVETGSPPKKLAKLSDLISARQAKASAAAKQTPSRLPSSAAQRFVTQSVLTTSLDALFLPSALSPISETVP